MSDPTTEWTLVCPACGERNPSRFRVCGLCGTPLAAPATVEVRKTVTVLFTDVAGSTSLGERLDPESLREVMARYFDVMQAAIERHGGTVEKFIGDAVMAVFGLPQAHEDDALRAVRAALDMRDGLERLNADLERRYGVRIANRTGVNTGEVVTDETAGNQRLATGDAVNVAARLEQAAPAMQTLLGALTHALVRDMVEAEPVEPLELKGKAEPVPAFRLIGIGTPTQAASSPLVGRAAELDALRGPLAEAAAAGAARLVAVIGEAGVGKTRLLAEFTARLNGSATVIRGRCLPYGEGITFWPLAEAVRAAAGVDEDDPPDRALAKVARLAAGDAAVADRVAAAIGLSATVHGVEETFWGIRRLFEILAGERPLVIVLEDMHWAEPTLVELVEHLLAHVRRPCLVVCSARPEGAPEPAVGDRVSSRIVLERLGADSTAELAQALVEGRGVDPALLERIVDASNGNPLFVAQMVAMLDDAAPGAELEVPPTILALLAARLDRLAEDERSVLEPAAVAGLVFATGAVVELTPEPDRVHVPGRLTAVERRRFIRSHASVMGDDEAYQFDHMLVRDAVYHRLLKRTRAQLHEQFVAWADRVNADRAPEYAEITAYHLEQAHRYLAELGPLDEHGRGLGMRAGKRLAAAGRRAFARGDMRAAAGLLRRAAELMSELDPDRLALLTDLGEALMDVGEFERATSVLAEAQAGAEAIGDARLRAHARLGLLLVQMYGELGGWGDRALAEAESVLAAMELAGDQLGMAKAWRVIGAVHATALRYGLANLAVERAIACARLAGDTRHELRNYGAYTIATVYGPMPVSDALARCREIERRAGGDHRSQGLALCACAQLEAMRGGFAEARRLYGRAREVLAEVGGSVLAASTALDSSTVELLAGDPAAAERELVRDSELLEQMGERYLLSTMFALLAVALIAQGRHDEAKAACDRAEQASAEDDIESQVLVRSARAELALHAGALDEAAAAAAAAVELLQAADAPGIVADAAVINARVAAARGDVETAERELSRAAELYRVKGNLVSERRTDELRVTLGLARS